jgi:hypothetical protein
MASALSALAAICCLHLRADIIDDFETGTEGWSSRDYVGGGTPYGVSQGALDGHSGALLFGLSTWGGTFPDQQYIGEMMGGGGESDDLVVGLTNVAQSATENGSISFDFYANADAGGNGGGVVAPAGLYLYFTTYSGYTWYYDVFLYNDAPVTAGWNTYYVDLTYDAGWDNDDGRGAGDFDTDIADAQYFGVWVVYQNWNAQEYGLDNVQMYDIPVSQVIPEPATGALLLLGAAVAARRLRRRAA